MHLRPHGVAASAELLTAPVPEKVSSQAGICLRAVAEQSGRTLGGQSSFNQALANDECRKPVLGERAFRFFMDEYMHKYLRFFFLLSEIT